LVENRANKPPEQACNAYSVKTAMELFSPFNIYSWITKKEKIAKTMSQLGIEPKTSG